MSPESDDVETVDAWLERTLAAAPPLTAEQRDQLIPLFRGVYEQVLADRAEHEQPTAS